MNESRLVDYCLNFFGYGRWSAPVWFIGIEEAENEVKFVRRLQEWEKRERKDIEDAPSFYPLLRGKAVWHGPDATLQQTWKQLIRMLLIAQGKADTDNNIRDYQRHHLGAMKGDTCLLELLPLPCRSTTDGDWVYSEWSENLKWLETRLLYKDQMMLQRLPVLSQKIEKYRPKVVVFYGTSFLEAWNKLAGCRSNRDWDQAIDRELMRHERDGIMFFVTRHPTARILYCPDDYFSKIGRFFRDKCGSAFALTAKVAEPESLRERVAEVHEGLPSGGMGLGRKPPSQQSKSG